jgi:DNA-binding Lrp family transcriptional regulator
MKIAHDDLPTIGLARASDPSTSKTAAFKAERTTLAARTLCALRDFGPMTTSEIAHQLGCDRDSISPRMTKLVDGGWVENTGRERNGRIVWAAKGFHTASLWPTTTKHEHVDARVSPNVDAEPIIELAMCESQTLMLHPYKRYRFIPYADCLQCMKMLDEYCEATGSKELPR